MDAVANVQRALDDHLETLARVPVPWQLESRWHLEHRGRRRIVSRVTENVEADTHTLRVHDCFHVLQVWRKAAQYPGSSGL